MVDRPVPEIEVLRETLLALQVCSTITNPDEIETKVNMERPAGTSGGWQLVEEGDPALQGCPNPNQCSDHEDRKHWLFVC